MEAGVQHVFIESRNRKDQRLGLLHHKGHSANVVHAAARASNMLRHFEVDMGAEVSVRTPTGKPATVVFECGVKAADDSHKMNVWGLFGPHGRPSKCAGFMAPNSGSIKIDVKATSSTKTTKSKAKSVCFCPNFLHVSKRVLPNAGSQGRITATTTHNCIVKRIKKVERFAESITNNIDERATGWRMECRFSKASPLQCVAAMKALVERRFFDPSVSIPGVQGSAVSIEDIAEGALVTAGMALKAIGKRKCNTKIKSSPPHHRANTLMFNSIGISTQNHQTRNGAPMFHLGDQGPNLQSLVFDFSLDEAEKTAIMPCATEDAEEFEMDPNVAAAMPSDLQTVTAILKLVLDIVVAKCKDGTNRFYAFKREEKHQLTNKKTVDDLVKAVHFKTGGPPNCFFVPRMRMMSRQKRQDTTEKIKQLVSPKHIPRQF